LESTEISCLVNTALAGRVLDSRSDSKLSYATIASLFVATGVQWFQLWG